MKPSLENNITNAVPDLSHFEGKDVSAISDWLADVEALIDSEGPQESPDHDLVVRMSELHGAIDAYVSASEAEKADAEKTVKEKADKLYGTLKEGTAA